jgi:pyruvate,orthophosphate dikinase
VSRRSRCNGNNAFSVFRIPLEDQAGELPSKAMVGSKAHNLMRIARCGLPVPPGFVLGTDLALAYLARGRAALHGLEAVLKRELEQLGRLTGRHFGDAKRPLLVSVRSGAPVSMPGMMETVLNVGLTEATLRGLIRLTGNPRLALDCRRRFVQQFAEVVHGVSPLPFQKILDEKLAKEALSRPEELDSEGLHELADEFGECFNASTAQEFPAEPMAQLEASIEAVLKSWMSERAKSYRALNGLSDTMGTATIVQMMVFGNAGPTSGSGVGFTRSPAEGSNALYVDFLVNAQGEDVVAGRRIALGSAALERRAPEAYRQLQLFKGLLEQEFGDMQDFEFTIEQGRLYMLQARTGKRTPLAALRIAHDLVRESSISPADALKRLEGIDLDAIEICELAPPKDVAPIAHAVAASTGVAVGVVVLDPARIAQIKRNGEAIVLLRGSAETADVAALAEVEALVTALGARTSHAAVVARQLGKVCLVGCRELTIEPGYRSACFGDVRVQEGDVISVDGATGAIYLGEVTVRRDKPDELLAAVRSWRNPSKKKA